MNPKNHSLKVLIGKACPIDRSRCLISHTPWYESQHPENFELILKNWEDRGKELAEL